MELETYFLPAGRLGYLKDDEVQRLLEETAEAGRMLSGLIRRLKISHPDP